MKKRAAISANPFFLIYIMKKRAAISANKSTFPPVITIISVIGFLAALIFFFLAMGFFAAYKTMHTQKDLIVQETFDKIQSAPSYTYSNLSASQIRESLDLLEPIFPIISSLSLALMLLYVISSIFLLKRRNWARLMHIILAMFAILVSSLFVISSLFFLAIPSLIINVFIAGYLLFNKDVKKVFK